VTAYGVLAEFETQERLLEVAEQAYAAGFRSMDAYSPIPVHGLSEALGQPDTKLPWAVFAGGLFGGSGGYLLQWWTSAVDYPLNIGGRPLHSWPSFIPVTFELIILCAAFAAVFGLFIASRLPKPHHPLFAIEGFERATQDRFYLCIESDDAKYADARAFLESLKPTEVWEVAS
jgi:hypothetical protein